MFHRKSNKEKPLINQAQTENNDPFFGVQAKLDIGKADDKFEKEADETADKVVNQTQKAPQPLNGANPKEIQKKNSEPQEDTSTNSEEQEIQEKPIASSISSFIQRQEAVEEETSIQAKEGGSPAPASTSSTEQKLRSSKGGGRKMDGQTKGEMESGFGSDFSNVKIHTDSNAVQMNQELGAQAFTNGNDIYFNEGKYNPASKEGKHLLAHELTHTIQQKGSKDPRRISMKREPNAEDKTQLAKFELYTALLKAQREQAIIDIKEKNDRLIPQLEESLARPNLTPDQRKMLEGHKKNRQETWQKDLKKIDDAILAVAYEKKTYNMALERVGKHGKIVWHSSAVGSGWVWEADSHFLHEMANSSLFHLGKRHGMYYAKQRAKGVSMENAIADVIVLGVSDVIGLSGVVEGISGYDMVTGRKLETKERIMKGVLGAITLVSLIAAGGPRISGWAKKVGGTKFQLMQTSAGTLAPVLVVAEGGAIMALTQAEIFTLVAAGHLNASVMQMSGTGGGGKTPQSVPGLKGAHRGKPRGGGGKAADQAYAQKVNKANGSNPPDQSVYRQGVEFDGYNPKSKKLLDAKRSKGKGSWYDITGSSSFTLDVKIPDIIKQAKRQLGALKGSGASGIEWHISDPGIATQIRNLFKKEGINIIVKYTP